MHIATSNQSSLSLGFWNYTCNWGVHMCGLYETEAERDEIILGFLHGGDIAGDLQMYCPCERTEQEFIEKYGELYPECAEHPRQKSRFHIDSAKQLYYPDGSFDPIKMNEGLNAFYEESQKNGRRNVRATAEMVWALESVPGNGHLMAYESRLNYFIPGKPWISICMYNTTKFSGSTIMQVLQTHPFCISKSGIIENPFYEDPDAWLSKNAPEFLPENN